MQVDEWLSYRYSSLSQLSEEALKTIDDHLLPRTFFVGASLTLADLVLFGILHEAVVSCPPVAHLAVSMLPYSPNVTSLLNKL